MDIVTFVSKVHKFFLLKRVVVRRIKKLLQ